MIRRLRAPGAPKPKPYRVVEQSSPYPDYEVCRHRFDLTAELCAHRRQNRQDERGVFYTALPVVASC